MTFKIFLPKNKIEKKLKLFCNDSEENSGG